MQKSNSPSFGSTPPKRVQNWRLGAPHLVAVSAVAVAAVIGYLLRDRLTELPAVLESPDTQIRRALADQTRGSLSDVYGFKSGGTIELTRVAYREPVIAADASKALVTAMLDAEGRVNWREEHASLSYLGREQFQMKPCRIALWCANGDQFSRLRAVMIPLFRRLDAFNTRDLHIYERIISAGYDDHGTGRDPLLKRLRTDFAEGPTAHTRILAWQLRVERDTAEAGEDFELQLGESEPKKLRALYKLRREGDHWLIVSGL